MVQPKNKLNQLSESISIRKHVDLVLTSKLTKKLTWASAGLR